MLRVSEGATEAPQPRTARARTARSVLSALLVLAPLAAAQDTDTLYLRDGNTEMGQVVEEGLAGVTFQPEKGGKKVVPWADVQSIDYFDASEDLGNGLATLAAGNAEQALELFQTVLAAEDNRPMTVQQALFYSAFAAQRMGRTDEAAAAYSKLLKDFPKGRYLRLAGENLIALHLAKADAAGARAALDGIAAGAKGTDGADPLLALLEARLLEAQAKPAEARERYAALEGLAGAPVDLVQEAKLGKARTLLVEGKAAEAEPILRALIAESQSPRVQSGAWNGVGQIQSSEGRAKKDAERILEGLYAYLRTVVQYKPLPGESTEEYERALGGAARCFELLSEIEPNPERKKLLRERHRERIEQLESEYPGSSFLEKK